MYIYIYRYVYQYMYVHQFMIEIQFLTTQVINTIICKY